MYNIIPKYTARKQTPQSYPKYKLINEQLKVVVKNHLTGTLQEFQTIEFELPFINSSIVKVKDFTQLEYEHKPIVFEEQTIQYITNYCNNNNKYVINSVKELKDDIFYNLIFPSRANIDSVDITYRPLPLLVPETSLNFIIPLKIQHQKFINFEKPFYVLYQDEGNPSLYALPNLYDIDIRPILEQPQKKLFPSYINNVMYLEQTHDENI